MLFRSFTFRSSAEENADAESDISSEGTVSPGGQYTAEFSPDATPEPLENTAGSEGQYTLSLTSSIGTLTYYNQSDSRWADYLYGGSDPLSVYGCGPTVMAMIVNSFTEHTCQPPDMAAWAADNHYWSSGYGTKHEFIPESAAAFGLHAESFQDLTAEGVMSELKSGHILVALMGPGHFSDSGHFIIITDDWPGNQVRVADPARLERTQAAWDVQVVLDELLTTASAGGPVWTITPK
nr:C39 family peptidase [uncultured Schaedlerella sp.]